MPPLIRRLAGVCLGLSLLAGCSAPGTRAYQDAAAAFGFTTDEVVGEGFIHRLYLNAAASRTGHGELHVYLDGDGIPWHGRGRPALDPSPRNPLVLRLMAQDGEPAVYLGRPCYLGVGGRAACRPWHWTHGRYGEAVVASMTAALSRLLEIHPAERVLLIGYSGGGALAMLMAPRLPTVDGVVTLAANLDVAGWADHHGYSRLEGSMDPARQPPLPPLVRQWHWVGEDDREVPPQLVERGLSDQPAARLEVIPGIDHSCCWESHWPRLLEVVSHPAHVQ